MRLAALTATRTDVDELSKTLKLPRPSTEAIKQAAPAAARPAVKPHPARPVARQVQAEPSPTRGGNLMLIAIVVLLLLGVVAIFVL